MYVAAGVANVGDGAKTPATAAKRRALDNSRASAGRKPGSRTGENGKTYYFHVMKFFVMPSQG